MPVVFSLGRVIRSLVSSWQIASQFVPKSPREQVQTMSLPGPGVYWESWGAYVLKAGTGEIQMEKDEIFEFTASKRQQQQGMGTMSVSGEEGSPWWCG